jgi:hypothetical protein
MNAISKIGVPLVQLPSPGEAAIAARGPFKDFLWIRSRK